MSEHERAGAIAVVQIRAPSPIESAPHLLRCTIRFPYIEDAQSVASLYLSINAWNVVNEAFERLPRSTEQDPPSRKVPARRGDRRRDIARSLDGLVRRLDAGEAGHPWRVSLAYLESEVSSEKTLVAAQGWGGDAYLLFPRPRRRRSAGFKRDLGQRGQRPGILRYVRRVHPTGYGWGVGGSQRGRASYPDDEPCRPEYLYRPDRSGYSSYFRSGPGDPRNSQIGAPQSVRAKLAQNSVCSLEVGLVRCYNARTCLGESVSQCLQTAREGALLKVPSGRPQVAPKRRI